MIPTEARYVNGIGPRDAALMFVGEAPGASEEYTGEPFVGPTGQLLDEICREIGIDRREVYITNVIKYRPPGNQLKRLPEIGVSIDQAIDQLWEEINAIKPNCIVGFGNLPLKALCGKGNGFKGIMKWRGSCMKSKFLDYKVVPTIHPAALLHAGGELDDDDARGERKKGPLKYSWRHILKLDLLRAVEQAESRIYNPPERVIEIARDSIQLQRFLDLYRGKDIISVDIEVVKSIPFCVGLAFNSWHAISVPLLDVFSWQNLEGIHEHELATMWQLIAALLDSGIKVIGQNFKFDQRKLAQLCGFNVRNFHCDTSLLAHTLHPEFPKALDFTTSIYTMEPYYKEEGKEFDWKRDKVDRFLNYNGRDACVTFEVFEEMMKDGREIVVPGYTNWFDEFFFGHVMPLHSFYDELEGVGFAVDKEKQKQVVAMYKGLVEKSQAELNQLAGWEVNVNSPKQCCILLYHQLNLPLRKGADEDTIVAIMGNAKKLTVDGRRMCELILEIRRLKIAENKSGARPDYDDRMKTSFNIAGTETGRSSTKILKPPMRPEPIGMQFHSLTKHGDFGLEAREFLVADDGYVIVETDMSQAEARIVAEFGQDKLLKKLFAEKADVHRLTASWLFGIKPEQVTFETRFIGKTCRHAGNYDMMKHRLMTIVNTDAKKFHIDVTISEYKAGKILDTFHRFSPNIRGVFHEEIQRALRDNNNTLVNPFGRRRQFFDRWGRGLWKEAYAHLPQSTVPDHLRRAGIAAKRRFASGHVDARFVVEAHDALVAIVKEGDVEEYVSIMHEEIEQPIDFAKCSLPRGFVVIPAETKVGHNYREFNKKTGENPKGLRDFHLHVEKRVA